MLLVKGKKSQVQSKRVTELISAFLQTTLTETKTDQTLKPAQATQTKRY